MKEGPLNRNPAPSSGLRRVRVVATFVLGYGYWRLATARTSGMRRSSSKAGALAGALSRLQQEADGQESVRTTSRSQVISLSHRPPWRAERNLIGRDGERSQRIVAAAARDFLSSRGARPWAPDGGKDPAESAFDFSPLDPRDRRAAVEEPARVDHLTSTHWLVLAGDPPRSIRSEARR